MTFIPLMACPHSGHSAKRVEAIEVPDSRASQDASFRAPDEVF